MSGSRAVLHAEEFAVDLALVRRLLAGQFPQWAELPLRPVRSDGTCNAMFRLGPDMAVRLPRVPWAVGEVDAEHRWLPRLAPELPCAVPAPLAKGRPAEGYPWPWSVYSWLPGVNPRAELIDEPALFAEDLAAFTTALHRINPSGGPAASRGVPLAERDAGTREAIGQLDGIVDTAAATAAWERALAAEPWQGPGVWVHGDLQAGNLLVTDGRLDAVIDFGCLGVGDPAVDLITPWSLLSGEARAHFRTASGADPAMWERGRGWALSIALIELPYYRGRNESIAANARHVIEEVLADRD